MKNAGRINAIIGPGVDVEFDGAMPPVYEKLVVEGTDAVFEVLSHVQDRKSVV